MASMHVPLDTPRTQAALGGSAEERLERGDVLYFPVSPFALPQDDDLQFLLQQRLANRAHKNISYNPHTGKAGGFARQSPDEAERVRSLLAAFSRAITAWVAHELPNYTSGWRLDRASYRPEEEATRSLRQKARNDLLHIDAFPSRPTHGYRILRVFANINPEEPRIWLTSESFAHLLARYGTACGLPSKQSIDWLQNLGRGMLDLFRPGQSRRSVYDTFMLRFHDFLKANEDFQERTPKRFWAFAPGSVWVAFTDTCSHAVLRGRFALEHSYFIAPEALTLPEESPPVLLARACGMPVLQRAA